MGYKNGSLTAGSLPSGIDAEKIADGSVSNAEFQRLDGVSSGIQTQIDSKQAGIQYKDEGSDLGASATVTAVDFVGAGVTAARATNTVTVTIPGATGDVTAGANLTDNKIVRGDGGAKGVQTSGVGIDDSNNITGANDITSGNNVQAGNNLGMAGRFYAGTIGNNIPNFVGASSDVLRFSAGDIVNPTGFEGVKKLVEAKTANYPVTVTDTGKVFTNEGTTAKRDFSLPDAAAGLSYEFFVQDSDGLRVVAAAGDTIRIEASVSAAAGNIESTTVGSSIILRAVNATEWVSIGKPAGTWTVT